MEIETLQMKGLKIYNLKNQPYGWFFKFLCRGAGSNRRLFPLQGNTLPTELPRHILFSKSNQLTSSKEIIFLFSFYCPIVFLTELMTSLTAPLALLIAPVSMLFILLAAPLML